MEVRSGIFIQYWYRNISIGTEKDLSFSVPGIGTEKDKAAR